MFTASTIFASFLLFSGFNTAGAPAVSLLGGFIVIFVGVYLLNLNRLIDPVTQQPRVSLVTGEGLAGTGRLSEHHERLLNGDGYHSNHTRFSLNGRESMSQYPSGRRNNDHRRQGSNGSVLFSAYDHEENLGLNRMDDSDEEQDEEDQQYMARHSPKITNKKASKNRTFSDAAPIRNTFNEAAHHDAPPDSRGNHRR
jgi:hypothetical protein